MLKKAQRVSVITGQHAFSLLVVIQSQLVSFTANTGFLVATKSSMGRVSVVAVHPYPTGLNAAAHAVGPVSVPCPNAGTQAKLGIVGNRQSFFFGFEGCNTNNWAKDFFLEHPHAVITLEKSGLNVESVIELAFHVLTITACENNSAFLLAYLKVRHDFVELLFTGLRTNLNVSIQRITALDRFCALHNLLHELFIHVFLNQSTRWTGADFTLIEERQNQTFNTLVDKLRLRIHYIREVDVGRLTAKLNR